MYYIYVRLRLHSDYPQQGYYGQSTFIAGQAPMNNTIENTWNAITQQKCSVVVVLTNFEEQNQVRCTNSIRMKHFAFIL